MNFLPKRGEVTDEDSNRIAFVANIFLTPALVALTKRFQGPTRAG